VDIRCGSICWYSVFSYTKEEGGAMNFDFWQDELTIYEERATTPDEGSVLTIHEIADGYALHLEDNYTIKEEDDGYGGKVYVIRKEVENEQGKKR
jgi:hypothetical protein